MIFVCPQSKNLGRAFAEFSRLYAYPRPPRPPASGGIVILDSGAFGLSQRGRAIDAAYMRRLAKYYRAHEADNVYRIAPDEYLNPRQTMENWSWWQEHIGQEVVPVIQLPRVKHIDLYSVLKQVQFYAPYCPRMVAISNPGLRAIESNDMRGAVQIVRQVLGSIWLHNLGAGWDLADIKCWRDMNCFESIDSIAYYTAAQSGECWDGTRRDSAEWGATALINAQLAQEVCNAV